MNNKFTCHQNGVLFMKCKTCGYSWTMEVLQTQEVIAVCDNCGNDDGAYLEVTHKMPGQVDIPEFMSEPKEVVTYEIEELKALTRLHYDLGKQKGLSKGITIGLIILGITLFLLFAPMTVLPG